MKLGTDIVYIPRFEKTLRENQQHFEQNVFCREEWAGSSIQRLAGIFAAKEAALKALDIKPGQWQEICVKYSKQGKPFFAHFLKEAKEQKKWKHELSISHDGEYAAATTVFYQ
ncbi:4'-phosphopantetheinyl transferase superfamily protein [Patescibacteria group bacterium]|nr:4'-phosphopantetheinyl transferase superfamily protein [Patescibacteria group bacterium]